MVKKKGAKISPSEWEREDVISKFEGISAQLLRDVEAREEECSPRSLASLWGQMQNFMEENFGVDVRARPHNDVNFGCRLSCRALFLCPPCRCAERVCCCWLHA